MSDGTGSLFASLRRLADTAVGIVLVRVELLGTELEQEKLRVIEALTQAAIGLMLIALALVLAIGFVLLLFWDTYRLPALGVLMVGFAASGAVLLQRARQSLHAPAGGPFALTLGELRRDRDGLGTPPAPGA